MLAQGNDLLVLDLILLLRSVTDLHEFEHVVFAELLVVSDVKNLESQLLEGDVVLIEDLLEHGAVAIELHALVLAEVVDRADYGHEARAQTVLVAVDQELL